MASAGCVRRWTVWMLFLSAAVPAVASADTVLGADSPQALVARMTTATEAGDFGEIAACLAPEDRTELALGMLAGAGMMVAFMGFGGEMAGGLAEGMAEAFSEEDLTEEQRAEIEAGKKEAALKTAELQARYESILTRHGLDEIMSEEEAAIEEGGDSAAAAKAKLAKVDQVSLLRDLMGLLEDLGEGAGEGMEGGPLKVPGEVTDYHVEGNRATARSGEETIEFVRVEGRWYFKPTSETE